MSEAALPNKAPTIELQVHELFQKPYARLAYSMAARMYPELYKKLKEEFGNAKEIAARIEEATGCEIFFPESRKGKIRSFARNRFYEISEYRETNLSWREISDKYREVGISISHGSLQKGYRTALAKFESETTKRFERMDLLSRIKDAKAELNRGQSDFPNVLVVPKEKVVSPAADCAPVPAPESGIADLLRHIEDVETSNSFFSPAVTTKKKEDIGL